MAKITISTAHDPAEDDFLHLYRPSILHTDGSTENPGPIDVHCTHRHFDLDEIGLLPPDCPEVADVVRLDDQGRVSVGPIVDVIQLVWGRDTFTWTIHNSDVVFMLTEHAGNRGLPLDHGRLQVPKICRAVLGVEPGDEIVVLASSVSIVLHRQRPGNRRSQQ